MYTGNFCLKPLLVLPCSYTSFLVRTNVYLGHSLFLNCLIVDEFTTASGKLFRYSNLLLYQVRCLLTYFNFISHSYPLLTYFGMGINL